jgi:hypothetical protein
VITFRDLDDVDKMLAAAEKGMVILAAASGWKQRIGLSSWMQVTVSADADIDGTPAG